MVTPPNCAFDCWSSASELGNSAFKVAADLEFFRIGNHPTMKLATKDAQPSVEDIFEFAFKRLNVG